jgi:hypothetical protein
VLGTTDGILSSVEGTSAVTTRYRCTHCGNLTRFDVTLSRRSRSYHHYTVGGDLEVEETEVLDERVEEVACRWCGTGKDVVAIDGEAG